MDAVIADDGGDRVESDAAIEDVVGVISMWNVGASSDSDMDRLPDGRRSASVWKASGTVTPATKPWSDSESELRW